MAEEIQAQEEDTLQIGYVVAMDKNGDFIFEIIGKNKGLVELMGIHQHATRYIEGLYNNNLMRGDRLTHEVGEAVRALNEKLDKLFPQADQKPCSETCCCEEACDGCGK